MIQNLDFFIKKTLTFEDSNRTLFLQNTDFHRVELTLKGFQMVPVWDCLFGTFEYGKNRPPFSKMQIYFRGKCTLFIKYRGHANFTKIDPFSANIRTMMHTYL